VLGSKQIALLASGIEAFARLFLEHACEQKYSKTGTELVKFDSRPGHKSEANWVRGALCLRTVRRESKRTAMSFTTGERRRDTRLFPFF
jgi:hypothetical protein